MLQAVGRSHIEGCSMPHRNALTFCIVLFAMSRAAIAADTVLPTSDEVLEGLREFYRVTARADGSFQEGVDPDYLGMSDCAYSCLLYTSPSPRDKRQSRMPSSA